MYLLKKNDFQIEILTKQAEFFAKAGAMEGIKALFEKYSKLVKIRSLKLSQFLWNFLDSKWHIV